MRTSGSCSLVKDARQDAGDRRLDERALVLLREERLLGESLVQFDVGAIQALSVAKGRGGERLEVAHAGMKTEIKQMGPGQADGLIAAFREVKRTHLHYRHRLLPRPVGGHGNGSRWSCFMAHIPGSARGTQHATEPSSAVIEPDSATTAISSRRLTSVGIW